MGASKETLEAFLKNDEGKFVWPGFGENARVLRWMVQRVDGQVGANKTAIGSLPNLSDLAVSELSMSKADEAQLLDWSVETVRSDLGLIEQYLAQFGDAVPERLKTELNQRVNAL